MGCSVKIHKYYSFTEPVLEFGAVSIHAKLRGTMKNVDDKHSSTESPYELLIWFSSNGSQEPTSCSVVLNGIVLRNVESDVEIPISANAIVNFRLKSDGSHGASVIIRSLELEYESHKLDFMYSFEGGCYENQPPTAVKFEFRKDYTERKISFWDTLMGI